MCKYNDQMWLMVAAWSGFAVQQHQGRRCHEDAKSNREKTRKKFERRKSEIEDVSLHAPTFVRLNI